MRNNLSFKGFRIISSIDKHLTEGIFNSGSGNTMSWQAMGVFLGDAAKRVTSVTF